MSDRSAFLNTQDPQQTFSGHWLIGSPRRQGTWAPAAVDGNERELRFSHLDLFISISGAAPCLNLELHGCATRGDQIGVDGDLVSDMNWSVKDHAVDRNSDAASRGSSVPIKRKVQ